MNKKRNTASKTLRTAVDAIASWESDVRHLDDILDGLANHPQRAIVADLLFAYFRNKGLVDGVIERLAAREVNPKVHRVLAATLTQVFFQTGIDPRSAVNVAVDFCRRRHEREIAGFVNAVARNAIRQFMNGDGTHSLADHFHSLPSIVRQRWNQRFGAETIARLTELAHRRAPMTLQLAAELSDEELAKAECLPLDLPDWAGDQRFVECAAPEKALALGWLRNGTAYARDPSTVFASRLGKVETSRPRVADLCAAPGGKTLSLARRFPEGRVVACDISLNRHERTLDNVVNHRLDNVDLVVADAFAPPLKKESFDLILIDAPCSNTGVFRRRPDVLWRFSRERLRALTTLQRNALAAAAPLVAPSAFLVHSTCSLETEENDRVVQRFLADHPEFRLVEDRLILPGDHHDGGYAALLQRK